MSFGQAPLSQDLTTFVAFETGVSTRCRRLAKSGSLRSAFASASLDSRVASGGPAVARLARGYSVGSARRSWLHELMPSSVKSGHLESAGATAATFRTQPVCGHPGGLGRRSLVDTW